MAKMEDGFVKQATAIGFGDTAKSVVSRVVPMLDKANELSIREGVSKAGNNELGELLRDVFVAGYDTAMEAISEMQKSNKNNDIPGL